MRVETLEPTDGSQRETESSRMHETDLCVKGLLDGLYLGRLYEQVASIQVGDDELLVRRELVVLPDQDLLDRLVTVERKGTQETLE